MTLVLLTSILHTLYDTPNKTNALTLKTVIEQGKESQEDLIMEILFDSEENVLQLLERVGRRLESKRVE